MKPNLMALSGTLALVLACGEGRTGEPGAKSGAVPAGAAGIEDTTAAPSADLGTPSTDTAADTGGASRAADSAGYGGDSPE